ncbi:MAG: CoA-binding protein [Chloroflexota bacterium]|nr:CoA-binding protein [Chloroflexota bacterium]
MNKTLKKRMDCLFNPESIAVIGASNVPGKWGFNTYVQILGTSLGKRKIFPVNNKTEEVLGQKAYPSIRDIPEPVDFAVIIVPYQHVPPVMQDCVAHGVKSALVITAGLGEVGEEGKKVEKEVVRIAQQGGIRFVGPNCMGHFDTTSGFYTTGWGQPLKQGSLSLVAQSGGFTGHLMQCGMDMGVGFNKLVSSGNEADLHTEDYLEYYAQDHSTKVIGAYVEGFREGERFLKLARETSKKKPLVIMKVGRTPTGSMAAMSHTGALSGTDAVCDAALKQSGVIRADEIEELFDISGALLRQPLPRGNRVGILTGGGGHGVVTTDACERLGLQLAKLAPETIDKIDTFLPPRWSKKNPVDLVGTTQFVTYQCLWPIIEDDNVDSIIVVGCIGLSAMFKVFRDRLSSQIEPFLQTMPDSVKQQAEVAMQGMDVMEEEELKNIDIMLDYMDRYQKPIIIIGLMATHEAKHTPVFKKLEDNGILWYPTPERAAKVVGHLVQYSRHIRDSN